MSTLETWELFSYVVTVIGFPLAIFVFAYEQRRERENEDESVYQLLSDNYQQFLRTALQHPDLKLFAAEETPQLSAEQNERMFIIFSMLVSLFERAFLLLYDETMTPRERRRWLSWEDYMREWCRRADFRRQLPLLLRGEDPEFVAYIQSLLAQESGATSSSAHDSAGSAGAAHAGLAPGPVQASASTSSISTSPGA